MENDHQPKRRGSLGYTPTRTLSLNMDKMTFCIKNRFSEMYTEPSLPEMKLFGFNVPYAIDITTSDGK